MSHTPAFRLASAAACATLALALVACGNANTQQEAAQETPVVYDTSTNGNAATPAATTPAASTVDPNRDHDFAVDPNNKTEWRTTSDGTNTIWLTFDDGPSELTSQVLDTLDRYGVKATFFVTNISPAHANMIGEAYRRGHTIGLHTSATTTPRSTRASTPSTTTSTPSVRPCASRLATCPASSASPAARPTPSARTTPRAS